MFVLQHPDEAAILIAFFLLVAFPVHELCHAIAAWRLGDDTAQRAGRLTLNPLKHFDPIGGTCLVISVCLTGMPLGYASTPVNHARLRGQHGEAIVAAAGPLSNVAMAVGFGLVTRVLAGNFEFAVSAPERLWILLGLLTYSNIFLAIFNFIPVPPLDGSMILLSLLPPRTRFTFEPAYRQYGLILFFAVFLFGGYVMTPIADAAFHALVGY
jgi:Zn-dependent protease